MNLAFIEKAMKSYPINDFILCNPFAHTSSGISTLVFLTYVALIWGNGADGETFVQYSKLVGDAR